LLGNVPNKRSGTLKGSGDYPRWVSDMTYAPPDLLAIRQVFIDRGAPLDAVGIVGDANHVAMGGYHEGRGDLVAADRLSYDYSVVESPRDRNPTDAASAIDFGDTDWWHPLSLWLVDACNLQTPGTLDVREIIYTPDLTTVRRWDRLGIRASGDASHLWHTHISFFRDSEGRRGDFLTLLNRFFAGEPVIPVPRPSTVEDDSMIQFKLNIGFLVYRDAEGRDIGAADWTVETKQPTPAYGQGYLSGVTGYLGMASATAPVDVEVATADGAGWHTAGVYRLVPQAPQRLYVPFTAVNGSGCLVSLRRIHMPDTPDAAATAPVTCIIEPVPHQ
jgi:hypothetical protein